MTDMKRVTVAFPDDIDMAVMELKKTDAFRKYSYSGIIRHLVKHGLSLLQTEAAGPGGFAAPESMDSD